MSPMGHLATIPLDADASPAKLLVTNERAIARAQEGINNKGTKLIHNDNKIDIP